MKQFIFSRVAAVRRVDFSSLSFRKYKRYLPVGVLIAGAVLATVAVITLVNKSFNRATDPRIEVLGAKARQEIARDLSVPIRGETGEVLTDMLVNLESAELRDEIIVQGQRATAVKGRTFLILNVKLTNSYSQPIEVNVKNFFRLTVGGNESEFLAADIHNDPVVIQPQSTKYTRIGFPINDDDSGLAIWLGEAAAEKKKIDLSLK